MEVRLTYCCFQGKDSRQRSCYGPMTGNCIWSSEVQSRHAGLMLENGSWTILYDKHSEILHHCQLSLRVGLGLIYPPKWIQTVTLSDFYALSPSEEPGRWLDVVGEQFRFTEITQGRIPHQQWAGRACTVGKRIAGLAAGAS